MFPISLLSSFVYSLSLEFSCSISSCSFFIVFIVLCPLALLPFYHLQFLSNLVQYFLLYFLSDQPNSFFVIDCPSSSPLLNVPTSLFCFLTSSISH